MVDASSRSPVRWSVRWRMANRSRSRRLWQPLRMPRTATSSRHQDGMRIPRQMRESGMARKKLIRSGSAAAAWDSDNGEKQSHQAHRRLTAKARAIGGGFESALGLHRYRRSKSVEPFKLASHISNGSQRGDGFISNIGKPCNISPSYV